MRFTFLLVTIICALSLFVLSTRAQTVDFLFDSQPVLTEAVVKEISSAKALVAAFKTGLYGRAAVRVLIDEAGNVSLVESVSGPGNICPSVVRTDVVAAREAAANAARKVKFVPAKVGDQPMASAGWLYFEIGKPEPAPDEGDEEKIYLSSDAPPKVPAKNQPDSEKGERYTAIGNGSSSGSGVLNGKAISLPRPPYPPAARAVRASGPVVIQVLIDEDGSMFSAEAVSGHPLLRSAARTAACGASFSPTLLSGQPVKVTGVITYNFVP